MNGSNENSLLKARLVWDGGDEVRIPAEMGLPRNDQMQGTAAERLTELAGRVCYDSLGKGRPSFRRDANDLTGGHGGPIEGYHDHILTVGHGSVLEHFNFTVEMQSQHGRIDIPMLVALLNRPGVYSIFDTDSYLRITLNLRSVLDWDAFGLHIPTKFKPAAQAIGCLLQRFAHELAPHVIRQPPLSGWMTGKIVTPCYDDEAWISLFMSGSRGFSHEQVRHGDFTAISQRSTRYVDESESPWVEHPLLSQWLSSDDPSNLYLIDDDMLHAQAETMAIADENGSLKEFVRQLRYNGCDSVTGQSQILYRSIVHGLEHWLVSREVDRGTARKQARGAARGYLGNALATEMIFSASVAQWRRMIRQRASVFADAEIRVIYTDVLRELKASRYADSFAAFELEPSPDGIGMVAVERA